MHLFLDAAEFAGSIFSGWIFSAPFRVMLPGQHQHSKGCTDTSAKEVLLLRPPFQWQLHVRKRELWWWCKLVLLPIAVANMCLQKFSSDVWWIGQDMNFVSQAQLRRVSCNWHSSQASSSDTPTPPVGFQILWSQSSFHIRTKKMCLVLLFFRLWIVFFLPLLWGGCCSFHALCLLKDFARDS